MDPSTHPGERMETKDLHPDRTMDLSGTVMHGPDSLAITAGPTRRDGM